MNSISLRFKGILSRKITVVGLGILLLLAVFQFSQIFYKKYETEKEIEQYEKEIAKLEQQQKKLKDLLTFLNTDYFAEREARLKLGMQKSGEHAVIIPKIDERVAIIGESTKGTAVTSNASDSVVRSQPELSAVKKNNPTRWWDYFFSDPQ